MTKLHAIKTSGILALALMLTLWLIPVSAFADTDKTDPQISTDSALIVGSESENTVADKSENTTENDSESTVADKSEGGFEEGMPVTVYGAEDGDEASPVVVASPDALVIVAFDPENGTEYGDFYTIQVPEGDLVPNTAPIPVREGYDFQGWAYAFDVNDTPLMWNFATMTVTDNTTLWAVWNVAPQPEPIPGDGGEAVVTPEAPSTGPDAGTNSGTNNAESIQTGDAAAEKGNLPQTGDTNLALPIALVVSLALLALPFAVWAHRRSVKKQ